MAFKIEGKEMYLIFVFAKCCWSVHSYVVRFGKHAKTIAAQTLQFHEVYVHAVLVQHLQCIFSTYDLGMVQNVERFICREGRKIG